MWFSFKGSFNKFCVKRDSSRLVGLSTLDDNALGTSSFIYDKWIENQSFAGFSFRFLAVFDTCECSSSLLVLRFHHLVVAPYCMWWMFNFLCNAHCTGVVWPRKFPCVTSPRVFTLAFFYNQALHKSDARAWRVVLFKFMLVMWSLSCVYIIYLVWFFIFRGHIKNKSKEKKTFNVGYKIVMIVPRNVLKEC